MLTSDSSLELSISWQILLKLSGKNINLLIEVERKQAAGSKIFIDFKIREPCLSTIPSELICTKLRHRNTNACLPFVIWGSFLALVFGHNCYYITAQGSAKRFILVRLWLPNGSSLTTLPSYGNMLLCSDQSELLLARTWPLQHQTVFLIKWSNAIAQTF